MACLILASGVAMAKHDIKAYYNGQEATVTDARLKVGEPFTVDLYVTPDSRANVAAVLEETGGPDAYRLVSGDPKGSIVQKKGGPNETLHFHWVLEPGGEWVDGTAPLNIQYAVWGDGTEVQGYFTVVDAYISPERYVPPARSGSSTLSAACLSILSLLLAALKSWLPAISPLKVVQVPYLRAVLYHCRGVEAVRQVLTGGERAVATVHNPPRPAR